jgi:hypothetical protein
LWIGKQMSLDNPFVARNGLVVNTDLFVAVGANVDIKATVKVNGSINVSSFASFGGNVSVGGIFSATGNTNIGSGKLFIDVTNGRLGVNTASPVYSLSIISTDGILVPKGTTGDRPAGAEGVFRFNTTLSKFEGYSGGAWGEIGGADVETITPGGSNLSYQYNLSGIFTNTDTYFVGGNTGFGNSAPNAKLHVQGTANVSGDVRVGGSFGAVGSISGSNTLAITGGATLSNTLGVTGAATFSNNISASGNVTGLNISATANVTAVIVNANVVSSNNLLITASADFGNSVVSGMKIKAYKEHIGNTYTITTNAYTIDCSLGNIFDLTLANASIALTFSNLPASGNSYAVQIWTRQDATGSRVFTYPAAVKWSNASSPTLSTGASQVDILSFQTINGGTLIAGGLVAANVS